MGSEFTPIFLFIVVEILTALSMWGLSAVLGPKRSTAVKQMPYESGMDPIGDARQRFDVRYYLVAIVFLLFDVELLFLYPWAVAQWSARESQLVLGVGASSFGGTMMTVPRHSRPSSAGWSSARSSCSSRSWRPRLLMHGRRGSSNGGR